MTTEIDLALAEVCTLIKTEISGLTTPPGNRVWSHPADALSIDTETFPFVVVSKLNSEVGAWAADSFGMGRHEWSVLIAVYLNDGPVIVTNADDITRAAMAEASEWYKAIADLFYANMTLNGRVDIIGDEDGKLYEYVTDNILWNGRQFFGHLFMLPVVQKVTQGVSS